MALANINPSLELRGHIAEEKKLNKKIGSEKEHAHAKTVSTEIISIVIRSKICVSTKILLEDGQASLRCGKKHNIKILAGKLPQ